MKKLLAGLIGLLLCSPAHAQVTGLTIDALGAGTTVSATDLYPSYQGANPAVKVTALQLKTYALTGLVTAGWLDLSGAVTGTKSSYSCLAGTCTDINHINITSDNSVNGNVVASGFGITHNFGGAAYTGSATGISSYLTMTSTTGNSGHADYVGILSIVSTNGSDTAGSSVWGGDDNVFLGTGSTGWLQLIGRETSVAATSGTSVQDKIGLQIVQGSLDAVVASRSNIGITLNNGSGAQGWDCGFCIGNYAGNFAMTANGTILGAWAHAVARNGSGGAVPSTNAGTTLNGVDFSNVTFTGSAYKSSGFNVGPAGNVSIGSVINNTILHYIQGIDTSSSTASFKVANSGSVGLFQVNNDGSTFFPVGAVNVGTQGSNQGRIFFSNATSGYIQLNAPGSGALGTAVATLPINTGTIAELNLVQSWTAAQTFNVTQTIGTGAPTTITFNPTSTVGSTLGNVFHVAITTDPTTWTGATARPNFFDTTLNASVNTTNIWENFYSGVAVNGPGQQQGEINNFHGQITVGASAANTSTMENYEARFDSSGAVSNFVHVLILPTNNSTGTITGVLYGMKCQLFNNNTTAGSIASNACIDQEPWAGSGTIPTSHMFLRGADPAAFSSLTGHLNIGTLGDNGIPLYVKGANTSGGTASFKVADSSAGRLFQVNNDGSIFMDGGTVNLGSAGLTQGKVLFNNTTSGFIQVSAPSSGALASNIATLPINTGTISETNFAETFSATKTFSVPPIMPGYIVSGLPSGTIGMIAYVTDQLTTCAASGAVLTGGGAVKCLAFYNGTAWVGG